nr:bifunctional 4-hydroxy-2-oxoglutarate aldolase/2-dehydro-3-deoxy-phosphogluconate aldolase [uncultured Agathobacter sp.]
MNTTLIMNSTLKKLGQFGVVPVVVLDDAKDAAPLAKALCEGGLACAEVTFRTEAAAESIRIMTETCPEMVVGAGTVLTTKQVDSAIAAGAKFIVTPGLDPEIVAYGIERGIPVTPGVVSPSELAQAYKLGLRLVKFFPAEPSGGLPMIKALAAPYNMMQFMPTGGISAATLPDYLSYDKIFACGGSWMVKSDLIKSGDFERITALTKEAVELVHSIREV